MKKPETYRDLDYDEVIAFADRKGLNTESQENFREAAMMLFEEKCGKKKTRIKQPHKDKK